MHVWGIVLAAACAGCARPHCANQAFFGLPSPDGASIAFVFHRRCEAGTRITTDVSVLDSRSPLRDEPGNIFSVQGEQPVRVAWLSRTSLLVTNFAEPPLERRPRLGSIDIQYRPAAPVVAAPPAP